MSKEDTKILGYESEILWFSHGAKDKALDRRPQCLSSLDTLELVRDQPADVWPLSGSDAFLPTSSNYSLLGVAEQSLESRAAPKPAVGQSCKARGLDPLLPFLVRESECLVANSALLAG